MHSCFECVEESKRLFDGWWVGVNVAASHDLTIYEGPGFWKSMRSALCVQCRLGAASCPFNMKLQILFYIGYFLYIIYISFIL